MKALINGKVLDVTIEKRNIEVIKHWFIPDEKVETVLVSYIEDVVGEKGETLYSNRMGVWINVKDLIEDTPTPITNEDNLK